MERESVSTFGPDGHLSPEGVQAFLDGLPASDEARAGTAEAVRTHVEACARCRSEVEGWELLFSELDDLARLRPGAAFADRVLAGVEIPTPEAIPWAARIRRWLGLGERGHRVRGRAPARHLGPRGFQEYLEELLPLRERARMEAHLERCVRCGRELETWRGLLATLESLPAFEPSAGFVDRVMAQVRIGEAPHAGRLVLPTPAAWARGAAARIGGWLRTLVPGTRTGWAVASGVALAPAVVGATILYAVFSHPLLTPRALAAFLAWKVGELARATGGWVLDQAMGSAAAFHAVSAVDAVSASPLLAAGGGVLLVGLIMAAAFVLYRNLIPAPGMDRGYAHASS